MAPQSRFPGFHRLPIAQRRRLLQPHSGLPADQFARCLRDGGIDEAIADKMVENAIGTYSLPFGVALNFTINGRDRLAPMVVEEPSVIAAASNAARIVRKCGGFETEALGELMIAQVQLYAVANADAAREQVIAHSEQLLRLAAECVPNLVARGGGPRRLEYRDLGDGFAVVHVYVDCCDAMGANLVNTIAETLGGPIASIAEGQLGLRILSNLCDERRIRVRAWAEPEDLATPEHSGDAVIDGILNASQFAERDPYRAATHNKGIMNGVDSVVVATGNDYRAVEAGAHAFACRDGSYRPLAIWRRDGRRLRGEMEIPLALGIVGGTCRLHPVARLALDMAAVTTATELAELSASVGLASNLAALRALATHGIQRGHMSLHARSVATLAGARDHEVEALARGVFQQGSFNVDTARRLLGELRAQSMESSRLSA